VCNFEKLNCYCTKYAGVWILVFIILFFIQIFFIKRYKKIGIATFYPNHIEIRIWKNEKKLFEINDSLKLKVNYKGFKGEKELKYPIYVFLNNNEGLGKIQIENHKQKLIFDIILYKYDIQKLRKVFSFYDEKEAQTEIKFEK